MPSVEILCVQPCGPVLVGDLPFAVKVSADRRSHRSPRALFQRDFSLHPGVLYHLGNPSWRPGRVFFGYDLFDEPDDDPLVFGAGFAPGVRILLARLVAASSVGRILFTTDWQFGPAEVVRGGPFPLDVFWREHDARRLVFNAAYWIDDRA